MVAAFGLCATDPAFAQQRSNPMAIQSPLELLLASIQQRSNSTWPARTPRPTRPGLAARPAARTATAPLPFASRTAYYFTSLGGWSADSIYTVYTYDPRFYPRYKEALWLRYPNLDTVLRERIYTTRISIPGGGDTLVDTLSTAEQSVNGQWVTFMIDRGPAMLYPGLMRPGRNLTFFQAGFDTSGNLSGGLRTLVECDALGRPVEYLVERIDFSAGSTTPGSFEPLMKVTLGYTDAEFMYDTLYNYNHHSHSGIFELASRTTYDRDAGGTDSTTGYVQEYLEGGQWQLYRRFIDRAGLPPHHEFSLFEQWSGTRWDTTSIYAARYNPADSVLRAYYIDRYVDGAPGLDTGQYVVSKLLPDGKELSVDVYKRDTVGAAFRLVRVSRLWLRYLDGLLESEALFKGSAVTNLVPFSRVHYLYDTTTAPTEPAPGGVRWTLLQNPTPASAREGLVISTQKAVADTITVRLVSGQGQLLGQAVVKPAQGRRISLAKAGIPTPHRPGLYLVQVQSAQGVQVIRCVVE